MMRRFGMAAAGAALIGSVLIGSVAARAASEAAGWSEAAGEFRVQLHALAGEALILQLQTPSLEPPRYAKTARKVRWDAQDRLSEALRSANALLSMLEIAETSDRGPRVREILHLWIGSSRTSLADHLTNAGSVSPDAPLDPSTAAFLEEFKILLRRLDAAYAELEAALTVPAAV